MAGKRYKGGRYYNARFYASRFEGPNAELEGLVADSVLRFLSTSAELTTQPASSLEAASTISFLAGAELTTQPAQSEQPGTGISREPAMFSLRRGTEVEEPRRRRAPKRNQDDRAQIGTRAQNRPTRGQRVGLGRGMEEALRASMPPGLDEATQAAVFAHNQAAIAAILTQLEG